MEPEFLTSERALGSKQKSVTFLIVLLLFIILKDCFRSGTFFTYVNAESSVFSKIQKKNMLVPLSLQTLSSDL